ncbi:DUF1254 domain-containing protein [Bradyrhizobium altum]|uniref:DUF1254 domain-containing protein n=1 Tax=Bradyrhizobium altum TaxID=1571202 RepID=UPI00289F93F7|nr:DUF1254 domain-containing protein [Bradyrhizobium altum]
MKIIMTVLSAMSVTLASSTASAQTTSTVSSTVNVDNYSRAQTDVYFGGTVKNGGFGKFVHGRELAPPVKQGIVRPNRDTLYSFGVFDFDAGPVTITLPDGAPRFMGMQIVNEDQFTRATFYEPGVHVLTRESVGTRYAIVVVRFLVDFSDQAEIQKVHGLQDAIAFRQEHTGIFQVPDWDQASLNKIRAAFIQLGTTVSDTRSMFGATKQQVDPVKHLIGSAMLWGGNPEKDAIYLPIVPERNDGATIYRLTVGDVPVDGFWSLTVYGSDGFLEANSTNTYSVNSLDGKKIKAAWSPSSLVDATVTYQTASRSRVAGIILYACFARGPRSLTESGAFRRPGH